MYAHQCIYMYTCTYIVYACIPGLGLITIVIVIDCNRLHFLCNHNRNRNHTFSKHDVIVIMLCNHL